MIKIANEVVHSFLPTYDCIPKLSLIKIVPEIKNKITCSQIPMQVKVLF